MDLRRRRPQREFFLTRILAIESSCDETAAAVIEDETRVLSSVVVSQLDVHGKYGGVVPELASREHLRSIVPVVRSEFLIGMSMQTGSPRSIAGRASSISR